MGETETAVSPVIACGIETELGVLKQGSGLAENSGSDLIHDLERHCGDTLGDVEWDPRERLGVQYDLAEDRRYHSFMRDRSWCQRSNFLLGNGSRLYRDGGHLEISQATATDPLMMLVWNRAGYRKLDDLRKLVAEATGSNYRIFRNNVAVDPGWADTLRLGTWRSRSTWGSHLNVSSSQSVPEDVLIRRLLPFSLAMTIIHGTGKIGCDLPGRDIDFQISQRADFVCTDVSDGTTSFRPIVCTRNFREGVYADPTRSRRNHIIIFDNNMLELPEYLKGLHPLFIRAIEDGFVDDKFEIHDPVAMLHKISWDTELKTPVWLTNQREHRLVVDLLWDYCDLLWEYLERQYPRDKVWHNLVGWFSDVLTRLSARDWLGLCGRLDWVLKKTFSEEKLAKEGKTQKDPLAALLDLDYHDNNHQGGLFYTGALKFAEKIGEVVRLTTDADIAYALGNPPPSRSCWIVRIIHTYRDRVLASNYWHDISFWLPGDAGYVILEFGDPNILWDEELGRTLLSLPFEEFLEKICQVPGLSALTKVYRRTREIALAIRDEDEPDTETDEDSGSFWLWLRAARERLSGKKPSPEGSRPCNRCGLVHNK